MLLAVSVFLPWYGFTLTASGVATAQQNVNSVAQQFGNSAFQGLATSLGNSFNSLVGKQIATVSAHQALKYISVALLVLAGIAIVVTMARLAGSRSRPPRLARAHRFRSGALHRVPDGRAPGFGRLRDLS